ncbi:SAF domain-containing protein [Paenibacillus harenae]|uniref:SAF domain-containing protein n=1 Tax=Paenibacillus harenae TaxID=306543 RepID=UPI00278E7A2D|nr:SAF domain-containing protein [Paenibacillus harenae]MDQ0063617.1 hypothetical protein [Paenibacillus harenae]
MNRRRNLWISLIAALLSASLVAGLYQLQRIQMQREGTVAVVVPSRFIGTGERLTTDMLAYKHIPESAWAPNMLVDAAAAQGKETVIPLGAGEPILDWKVGSYYLQPKPSESTFQIPKEYIRSISNGIRAGDKVLLYASGEGAPRRLFEESIIVASVKSSGNVEIDNMDNPNLMSMADGDKEKMYASRREANGMIEYLNLNMTEAQWLELDGLCKDGKLKVVVAYSPDSLNIEVSGEETRS